MDDRVPAGPGDLGPYTGGGAGPDVRSWVRLMNPRRQQEVVIAAVHNSRQARRLDVTEDALVLEALRAILSNAGLRSSQLDGINIHCWGGGLSSFDVVGWLGGQPTWVGMQNPGIPAVLEAAAAISSGQCHYALIAAAQSGAHQQRMETAPWTRPNYEFAACWGMYTAAQFALVARRYSHLYNIPAEAFAEVAASIRTNGSKNPEAVYFGKPVTRADVLSSRMVADPLRLLECAMTSEGAAAILLTTRERAQDMDLVPISILGGCVERLGVSYNVPPTWELCGRLGERAANTCFTQAGIGRDAVDVAEIYDPFAFEVLRQLEAFGFCAPGEAGDFALEGNIRVGGRLPVATNGGLMSFSHAGMAQMLQKIIAAVLQLRGEMPAELAVADAEVAICSNAGSAALAVDVMLLGRQ